MGERTLPCSKKEEKEEVGNERGCNNEHRKDGRTCGKVENKLEQIENKKKRVFTRVRETKALKVRLKKEKPRIGEVEVEASAKYNARFKGKK